MKKINYYISILLIFSGFQSSFSQSWTSLGSGLDYPVNSIVDFNGSIYAGSDFVYNWDGNSWKAITNDLHGLFGVTEIDAMAVYDNSLFIGGTFFVLTPDQNWYNYAAKLNNGSWTTCGSGKDNDGMGMNDIPLAMISYGGSLYAGGLFSEAGGSPLNPQIAMYIARFDGSNWNPAGNGLDEHITDMVVYNNMLIVSGYFTSAGENQANYIAAWDGNSWHSLGSGMNSSQTCKVTALAVHNGNLYAGGLFETAGGIQANNIAMWNGSSWSPVGDGFINQVYTLASYNGNLYAGGNFSINSGGPGNYIAKWDGTKWSNVGEGTNGPVNYFYVKDNKLYVGGNFTSAGNQAANNIAVWSDGTTSICTNNVPNKYGYNLSQNYPNPFNPITDIKYQIFKNGLVTIKVYDILGSEISTLVNEEKPAGDYHLKFNASNLSSGVYFYSMTINNFRQIRKMVVAK